LIKHIQTGMPAMLVADLQPWRGLSQN
jgi:hypothetical protein